MSRPSSIQIELRAGRPGIVRLLLVATLLCGSAGLRAAHAAPTNTVMDWNNELLLITQATSGNLVAGPPDVAREIAVIGEAMSDAVNAATGSTISSYAYSGGLTGNANVAAATAAYTALNAILNDAAWQTPISSTNGSNVSLANGIIKPQLQAFLTSQLTGLGVSSAYGFSGTTLALTPLACAGSDTFCNGFNLGVAAGTAVNNAASTNPVTSGAVAAIQHGLLTNTPNGSGATPGVYVPPSSSTPTPGRPEMFPTWGGTTPTGIYASQLTAAETAAPGPPPIGSAAYAAALLQTQCQGSSVGFSSLSNSVQAACTAAGFNQNAADAKASATAALFWNDPGTTVQPPGHWLQIADVAMTSQGSSLLQSAQLTALLGEAMNDAGIAAWNEKYTYNLWRPITAIASNCNADGTVSWSSDFATCDPSWKSLIATPPHPDYLAGHPAFSGAAATVLSDFFANDNISFSSTSDYYCNGGTSNFNAAHQVISCTATGGAISYICSATSTPNFVNDLPVSCTDNATNVVSALSAADCNTVTTTGVNNNSLLICPITETFSGFFDASSGTNGSEFSRVVGGIHTPFSVVDALALGNAVGAAVMLDAPEPSTLSICAAAVLALTGIRRRRRATQA